MVGQTSMMHVRVDDKLKAAAAEKLGNLGLTVSDAVRILLTPVVKRGCSASGLYCRLGSLRRMVSSQGA